MVTIINVHSDALNANPCKTPMTNNKHTSAEIIINIILMFKIPFVPATKMNEVLRNFLAFVIFGEVYF
jgi:hypothetical protein